MHRNAGTLVRRTVLHLFRRIQMGHHILEVLLRHFGRLDAEAGHSHDLALVTERTRINQSDIAAHLVANYARNTRSHIKDKTVIFLLLDLFRSFCEQVRLFLDRTVQPFLDFLMIKDVARQFEGATARNSHVGYGEFEFHVTVVVTTDQFGAAIKPHGFVVFEANESTNGSARRKECIERIRSVALGVTAPGHINAFTLLAES